jgi:hypothetical protein
MCCSMLTLTRLRMQRVLAQSGDFMCVQDWMKHHGQTPRQAEHVWKWLYKDLAKDAFDVPGAPGKDTPDSRASPS